GALVPEISQGPLAEPFPRPGRRCFSRRRSIAAISFATGVRMLTYMRRQAQGTTIKILFWIIIAVFILWGVGSFTGSDALYAAAVNGESISPKEVRQAATQLEQ